MTIIVSIIAISVIIFVHELGHFFVAKMSKMKVEEFGFGFPPRIWGYKPKNSETTYTINWIPFGGFVKILGEDGDSVDERSFTAKKVLPRGLVIVAGVVMNVVLAFIIFTALNLFGSRIAFDEGNLPPGGRDVKIQIMEIAKDSPAEKAGLKILDELVDFTTLDDVKNYFDAGKGKEVAFNVVRDGEPLNLKLTPRANPPAGEGAVGIRYTKTAKVSFPIHKAIWNGLVTTYDSLKMIVVGFGVLIKNLIVTGKTEVEIAGPVQIAKFAGQTARMGFEYFLQFVAFISLNLAVINILPFPALDGGRLLFLVIEKIKGSPLPKKFESVANSVGFILLILLMIYITTKDIWKLMG